jgi:hypothetical protein
MTPLIEALQALNVHGEVELSGRWVKLQGERCLVYVVEGAWGAGYYTWCADPQARTVEFYRTPVEAIQAGLRRAAYRTQEQHNDGEHEA